MKKKNIKRLLEIIPGTISWTVILTFVVLTVVQPATAAIAIIIYLLFWVCRLLYMSTLLVLAHRRMFWHKKINWLQRCQDQSSDIRWQDVWHVVLYTVYREPDEVLVSSLEALRRVNFPKERVIVVLAGEAKDPQNSERLRALKNRFIEFFDDILITIHPEGIKGEIPCKGANATFAARQVKRYFKRRDIAFDNVLISCFDADTCPDKNYLACLTYHFITQKNRHRMSFQPLPVYSNNIFSVPAFARIIEIGSTFWQLIESMRYEKFVTFSSHSMSFKTLVEVGYWPVNMISEDSLIFWKCFLKFHGNYSTQFLEIPVYMDIAVGRGLLDTLRVQYRQKRRWAWGVETFVFVGTRFLNDRKIPLTIKIRKLMQILDSHINWATWSLILSFITPFLLFWGRHVDQNALVLFNLSYVNNVIFNSLTFIMLLCFIMSWEFIPPRPEGVSRRVYLSFTLQWFLMPLVSALLGSFPALDAQTRMMRGRYLGFFNTPKNRPGKVSLPKSRQPRVLFFPVRNSHRF